MAMYEYGAEDGIVAADTSTKDLDAKFQSESDDSTRAYSDTESEDGKPMSAFQDDILEALSTPDFHAKMAALLREGAGPDAARHIGAVAGREQLCLAALRDVLPKHGLGCTPEDLEAMLRRLETLPVECDHVARGNIEIYDCLGLAPKKSGRRVPWTVA